MDIAGGYAGKLRILECSNRLMFAQRRFKSDIIHILNWVCYYIF